MKKDNAISQLLLERYHLGKVTDKERKIVETAISSDRETYNRYEEIKKSDEELRLMYPLEKFPKLAAIKDTVVPSIIPFRRRLRYKPAFIGICVAAAVLLVAFFSTLYWLKGRNSAGVQENAVAQGTEKEIIDNGIDNDEIIIEPKQEQKPVQKQEQKAEQKPVQKQEQKVPQSLPEKQSAPDLEKEGIYIAAVPETDTGVKTRGGNGGQQNDVTGPSEEEANISIPPGFTFIFENMFANKQLSAVVIPGRITSIGKNAFTGNPLVSVTIGANVTVADEAFPGNFKDVYTSHNRAAGTYTRADALSAAWAKK